MALNELNIDFVTNTAKFVQGMKVVDKKLDDFQTKVSTTAKAVVALAGSYGFGAMIKSTIDAGDQIAKLSRRLEVSTETLSEMRHVTESAGVSFESLLNAWRSQQRVVSEAAAGFGEARNALNELGLSAERLNELSPDKQFYAIADALNALSNQNDKARLAAKLFESENVKVLQVMENGSQSIIEMREEAKRLGVSLSKDQAEGAEAASQALTNLNAVYSGLKIQVTNILVGPLTSFIKWLTDILPTASLNALIILNKLRATFNAFAGILAKIAGQDALAIEFRVNVDAARAQIAQFEKELDALIEKRESKPLELGKITGGQMDTSPLIDSFEAEFDAAIRMEERLEFLDEKKQFFHDRDKQRAEEQKRMFDNALSQTQSLLSGVSGFFQKDADNRKKVAEQKIKIAEKEAEFNIRLAEQQGRSILSAKKENEDNIKRVTDNATRAARKNSATMKNLAIAEATINTYKAAVAAFSAFAGITAVGPALGAAAAATTVALGLAQVGQIRAQPINAYKDGGFIPGGKIGLVGEAGPELVKGPAMVTSAKDTKSQLGNTININISAPNGFVEAQSIEQMKTALFRTLANSAARN